MIKRIIFNTVLNEVACEVGENPFNTMNGDLVVERIANILGYTIEELENDKDFQEWTKELSERN